MDNGENISKMNFKGHKLSNFEREYIQRVQQQNLERVKRWTKIRYRNRYVGGFLGFSVISIYFYSMWAIKQENFLDDFNEPETVKN